ncbi:MAG: sugar transporter ATP-binding protein, partial [Pseudonocardiales bacterium]|nr:sugar transporter ATP-binding protein [Pseudonocardiales bacterium]
ETKALTKGELVELITGAAVPDVLSTSAIEVGRHERVLSVDRVSVAHDGPEVSFELHRGEVLGIAGLVGSGRTELLEAIYGSAPRFSGSVTVDAVEIRPDSPTASIKAGLAFLTEDRRYQGIVADFSVARNITVAALASVRGRLPFGTSPGKERRTALRLMKELGVKASGPEASILSLSGGNQQKVLLARWLATNAKVLLLDEPTIGVDAMAKAEIQNHILTCAEQGMAVIVVSSEFIQLEEMCHRVVVLVEGELVGELRKPNISERALLDACFRATQSEVVPA